MASHDHNLQMKIETPPGAAKVVLAGNPNSGKSVFFNAFTGMYVDVSNYPGTTLEIAHGNYEENLLIDTPGVYGISSFNDEERIARDIILSADIVINVVNALHLERDLFLTQQIIDTGVPTVVALNMMDEVQRSGLKVDVALLEEMLGVPVIPTVAVKRQGLREVTDALARAQTGNPLTMLEDLFIRFSDRVGTQGESLLVLEGDATVAARHGLEPEDSREEIYLARRRRVNEIVQAVMEDTKAISIITGTLGRMMVRPLTGIPLLLLSLWAMYQVIGVFIAGTVVDFLAEDVFEALYEPAIFGFVTRFFAEGSVPTQILAGEFGLLTMTATYVFGILAPLVIGFYFFLALFEDSGYLPRLATLTDRLLTGIGLNGRAIIPLILGLGCVTMGTIVTRLLGTEREKRITIFLLALTIPCSAQLGVILGILAGLGYQFALAYVFVILSVFIAVGSLLNLFLPGRSSDLIIDLPALRLPRIDNVMKKTFTKSYSFIKEALPLFALGALIIGIFDLSGLLVAAQRLLAPLTVGWLDLPAGTATAFIMGIVRRDFAAAGLASMPLTPVQGLVSLVTITLFVPCIASVLIMFKERGKGEAALMWLGTWVTSFLVGGLVAKTIAAFSFLNEGVAAIAAAAAFGSVLIVLSLMTKLKSRDDVPVEA